MTASGTLLVYALLGLTVGAAAARREGRGWARAATFCAAALFWPLFAAFLLGRRGDEPAGAAARSSPRSAEVQAVQGRVVDALASLEGMAGAALAPEVARVRALAAALAAMDLRILEMDALLAGPELSEPSARACLADLAARGVPEDDARLQSVRARLRNIERLRALRERTREDLERIVLKLEELSSQLHLLKFAGRPEAEVVRSIQEIAVSIEGIAEGLLAEA